MATTAQQKVEIEEEIKDILDDIKVAGEIVKGFRYYTDQSDPYIEVCLEELSHLYQRWDKRLKILRRTGFEEKREYSFKGYIKRLNNFPHSLNNTLSRFRDSLSYIGLEEDFDEYMRTRYQDENGMQNIGEFCDSSYLVSYLRLISKDEPFTLSEPHKFRIRKEIRDLNRSWMR